MAKSKGKSNKGESLLEKNKVFSSMKDDTVEEINSPEIKKEKRDLSNLAVPAGQGGQFVDLGGGVRVPVSEINNDER